MTQRRLYLITIFFLAAVSCLSSWTISAPQGAEQEKPLQITVSILPQEYFVKRIGGSRVRVESLVQPGHSPATYAPTPRQMAGLATSEVYFRIGVPFENGLIPKLARSVPELTIVDQHGGIDLIPLEEAHEDHDEHAGDLDPHTWLDPMLALKQSTVIRDTLMDLDPAGAKEYNDNFTSLARDLTELDAHLRKTLAPFAGKSIYVFHPAYGYFCRAYGLMQKAISPGGKEPGGSYLARHIEQAKEDDMRVIFVQPQFSDKTARTIARSLGGKVVTIDPLAGDYLENMQSIAREIASRMPDPDQ
ncbi:MAG: zinc ABC transporter substrate-binding protein [Desulfobulbaceae bacterium]|nr:zinc ABC transporter substrate-binding protein [Desulfobulbaceae bacterium]